MTTPLSIDSLDLSAFIRPGDTVMWGQANAEPLPLTQALMAQRKRIGRFRVMLGIANHRTCLPEHAEDVDFIAYCGAGANRELSKAGVLEILPSHYSQMARQIGSGSLRIDVLLLQLSPPDADGRYSLSLAQEYLVPAIDRARVVIAEVNRQAPWVYGERTLRREDLDAVLHTDRALLESLAVPARDTDIRIAGHVASLIEDGATLQMGIGTIPDAVLSALGGHRDLGVHSGSLGDGVVALMESGVINNARKTLDRGVSMGGVLLGSRRLHDFCHQNPQVMLRSTDYTHNARVLARLKQFTAINSAVEVDLTGQVNSETAAGSYLGAVGGALDFLRGAQQSERGLPIIALPSTAGAHSRIVARLNGPVTVPRSDAGVIVTEFGIADLRGLSLRQRARKMLDIAHPEQRGALEMALAAMDH